jgi:hypothetical protein
VSVLPQQTSITAGSPVSFYIEVNDPQAAQITDAYGFAFQMNYNLPVQFDPAIATDTSWMNAQSGNVRTLVLPFPAQNRVDVGITRTSLTATAGAGRIAAACCITVIIDDIGSYLASAPEAFLSLSLSKALLIKGNGEVVPLNNLNAQGFAGVRVKIPRLSLRLKALLQGAYDPALGAMRTDLATQGLLPSAQPYAAAPPLNVSSFAPGVVDWVLVQLRHPAHPDSVLGSQAALIMSDGSIVDPLTRSALNFQMLPGAYYLTVLHRNHLPLMSAAPVWLSDSATYAYDFSSAAAQTYGQEALAALPGGKLGMWAGDIDQNRRVSVSGPDNDRRLILMRMGGNAQNPVPGYWPEDINLDGKTDYLSPSGDCRRLLQVIGSEDPTNIIYSEVP